jgi:hypothetical protein
MNTKTNPIREINMKTKLMMLVLAGMSMFAASENAFAFAKARIKLQALDFHDSGTIYIRIENPTNAPLVLQEAGVDLVYNKYDLEYVDCWSFMPTGGQYLERAIAPVDANHNRASMDWYRSAGLVTVPANGSIALGLCSFDKTNPGGLGTTVVQAIDGFASDMSGKAVNTYALSAVLQGNGNENALVVSSASFARGEYANVDIQFHRTHDNPTGIEFTLKYRSSAYEKLSSCAINRTKVAANTTMTITDVSVPGYHRTKIRINGVTSPFVTDMGLPTILTCQAKTKSTALTGTSGNSIIVDGQVNMLYPGGGIYSLTNLLDIRGGYSRLSLF